MSASLKAEYLTVVDTVCRRYGGKRQVADEYRSEALYVLTRTLKRVETHDEPVKFVAKCTQNAVRRVMKKRKKWLELPAYLPEPCVKKMLERIRNTASDELDEQIIELRLKGYTDCEAARELGVSRSLVNNRRRLMYEALCQG